MSVYFKSLRSSSSGNCLLIWTAETRIVIDCGFRSRRECERLLREHAGRLEDLGAVLVSHAHGDHVGYASLCVFASRGVPIFGDRRVIAQIYERHGGDGLWDEPLNLRAFGDGVLRVGDLC